MAYGLGLAICDTLLANKLNGSRGDRTPGLMIANHALSHLPASPPLVEGEVSPIGGSYPDASANKPNVGTATINVGADPFIKIFF